MHSGKICENSKVLTTLKASICSGLLSGGKGCRNSRVNGRRKVRSSGASSADDPARRSISPTEDATLPFSHPRERRAVRRTGANGRNQEPGSDVRLWVEQQEQGNRRGGHADVVRESRLCNNPPAPRNGADLGEGDAQTDRYHHLEQRDG